MANYLINDTQLTSVADAIRAKSGGSAGLTFPSGFISEIGNISGSNGAASSNNDVIFYDDLMNDCEGGIAYSYSAAEFAELTEMPANPDHSNFSTHGISIPMTSQGWNYSLSDAKAYVAKYGKLNIGQKYIPTDGKSHWICYIPEDIPVERWNTKIFITVSGGNVNWQIDDGAINTVSGDISVTFSSIGWHDVKISAPNGVTYYPYHTSDEMSEFYGGIQKIIQIFLGDSVTSIDDTAFCDYNITSIIIPDSVTSIGNSAFECCYGLKSITIPNNVTNIDEYAFDCCYDLKSITIPNNITSIGNYTFSSCYSLKSITIPDGVTNIGNSVFAYCYGLKSIIIPDGVISIGNEAFYNCHNFTSITIPNSVTNIGKRTFNYCYGLTSITISDSIIDINDGTFAYCYKLKSIIIPDDVIDIGSSAFSNCFNLTSITIPNSVTKISEYAFDCCYSLKNIIIENTMPPTLYYLNAFGNLMSDYTIIVPAGSRESYIAATSWSFLADHIVEATA